jgi:hypothetical protein
MAPIAILKRVSKLHTFANARSGLGKKLDRFYVFSIR